MISNAIWRGYEKPGGAPFYAPEVERGEDCPKPGCWGTLDVGETHAECEECGGVFGRRWLLRLGIKTTHRKDEENRKHEWHENLRRLTSEAVAIVCPPKPPTPPKPPAEYRPSPAERAREAFADKVRAMARERDAKREADKSQSAKNPMTKHYCDNCGSELPAPKLTFGGAPAYHTIRLFPFGGSAELCEPCHTRGMRAIIEALPKAFGPMEVAVQIADLPPGAILRETARRERNPKYDQPMEKPLDPPAPPEAAS